MPEYDVRDSAGNLVGKFIPADSGLVGFFIGLVLVVTVGVFLIGGWLIFQIIRLFFRYPKIMLPILGILLIAAGIEYYLHPQTFQISQVRQSYAQPIQATNVLPATVVTNVQPTAAVAVEATGIVNADRLNVRVGPGESQKITGKISKNDKVTIKAVDSSGEWLNIAYSGGTGWVSKKFITIQSSNTAVSSSSSNAESVSAPSSGMWIIEVDAGSEAANAGLQRGQVLETLNGQPIQSAKAANDIIAHNIGSPITAVLWENGKEMTVTITPRDKVIGITLCQLSKCPQGKAP